MFCSWYLNPACYIILPSTRKEHLSTISIATQQCDYKRHIKKPRSSGSLTWIIPATQKTKKKGHLCRKKGRKRHQTHKIKIKGISEKKRKTGWKRSKKRREKIDCYDEDMQYFLPPLFSNATVRLHIYLEYVSKCQWREGGEKGRYVSIPLQNFHIFACRSCKRVQFPERVDRLD